MERSKYRFKIFLGLFVIGGLTLFVVAVFFIGRQKKLFNPVFRLTTTFYNVSGLQVGNNIRFSGINVGTVDDIKIINDSTVMVYMIIEKEIQRFIKTDCKAAIGAEGIIGDRVLIITQGSTIASSVSDGQQLASTEPIETNSIITKLKVTADNTAIVTDLIAQILLKINRGNGTLGRLIQDSTIAENINQTIVNLKKSSKGLDENMTAAKSNFFLRRYYRKKEKAEAEKIAADKKENKMERKIRESKNKKNEAQKAKDINSNK